MKYVQVVFTDRPVDAKKFKAYTYLNTVKDLEVDDMVVIQAQDGYAIGQVRGFTDTISFDEKLLKKVVTKFEVIKDV